MAPADIRLHFETDALTLATPGRVLRAAIGPAGLAARHFRHTLPTPVELEAAIQDVEDALQALPRAGGATLYTHDTELAPLWAFAHAPAGANTLPRDAVEECFSRLAALAEGRPLTQDPLPDAPHFAALLLIVREIMHHLDFAVMQRLR